MIGVCGFDAPLLARVRQLLDDMQLPVKIAVVSANGSPPDEPGLSLIVMAHPRTLDAITQIKSSHRTTALIVIGRDSSQQVAIAAIKAGADDYLCDNRCDAELIDRLALHLPGGKPDCAVGSGSAAADYGWVGNSVAAQRIWASTVKVAPSRSTILIEGQTGVGKDVIALALHRLSDRAKKPLVTMNCAAIPDALIEGELMGYRKGAFTGALKSYDGKFKLAHGGTLFLDEVGELSLAAQAKILRVIEARQVCALGADQDSDIDVRIVAATNQNLERAVHEGRFRSDLYYRLAVVRLNIPSLSARRTDIAAIAAHLLGIIAADNDMATPAMDAAMVAMLEAHNWPGNVRELRNALEHAFVTADNPAMLRAADLPWHLQSSTPPIAVAETADERETLIAALIRHSGRKSAVAKSLNCSRMTLYRRLERAGLDAKTIAATVA
jgi:DNA-binding NtrC family response regulator